MLFILLGLVLCLLLVLSERAESSAGILAAKPLASSAFVGAAFWWGALSSGYGRLILLALVLSWIGDVLLISKRRPLFLAGLLSFLMAHFAYASAFYSKGFDATAFGGAIPPLAVAAFLMLRWLGPHLSGPFRFAVPVYVLAIGLMVASAASAAAATSHIACAAGAVLFALSDITVARDRFVAATWRNRAVGLPLYYAAQFLLASTVAR